MKRGQSGSDFRANKEHDVLMASKKEEAAGAAWEGADLERPISGEDPKSESLAEARRWVAVYGHLVQLEQQLFDLLAKMIPSMPQEAQREAVLRLAHGPGKMWAKASTDSATMRSTMSSARS